MRRRIGVLRVGSIIAAVSVLAVVGCFAGFKYGTMRDETVIVTDKERIAESDGTSRYVIFTDKGVFENTDSFWHLKFDSSDVYASLARDKKYVVTVYGWRVPFTSSYPNILEVLPVVD